MSSIKAGENNNLVPAQPKTTDEGTPENNKKMEVHDATEKTTDLSPKTVETEHKEEVLTGNLAQKAAQAMKLLQEKQANPQAGGGGMAADMASLVAPRLGAAVGGKLGLIAGGVGGGLHGAYDPGAYSALDEQGNPVLKRRSRMMGALRGALAGGVIGNVGGGLAGNAYGTMLHPPVVDKQAMDPRMPQMMGESGAAHPLNAINAANETMKHYGKAYNQGNQPAVQNYANQYQSLMQGASAANKQIGGQAIPVRPLPSTIAPAAAAAPKPAMPAPKPMLPGVKAAAAGGFDMNALMAGLKNVAGPASYGAVGGAALGGLAGLLAPGRDENGNTRGRFGAAMRGALGGGLAGGLGGAAMGHYAKDPTQKIMSGISQAGNQIQQQGAEWYKKLQHAQLPSSVTAWGAG